MYQYNTQEKHLQELKKSSGFEWEVSSNAYLELCNKHQHLKHIPVVVIEEDDGELYYYSQKGGYCTWSMEIADTVINIRDKKLWQVLPAIKYDLTTLPQIVIVEPFATRTLIATIKLDGDFIIQNKFSDNPYTVGSNFSSFHVNVSNALKGFINTFKLTYNPGKDANKIAIGSSLTGDFWNTSFTVLPNRDFTASANPKPVKVEYKDWIIEGQLGFKVVGHWEDNKGQPAVVSKPLISADTVINGILVLSLLASVVGTTVLVAGAVVRGTVWIWRSLKLGLAMAAASSASASEEQDE